MSGTCDLIFETTPSYIYSGYNEITNPVNSFVLHIKNPADSRPIEFVNNKEEAPEEFPGIKEAKADSNLSLIYVYFSWLDNSILPSGSNSFLKVVPPPMWNVWCKSSHTAVLYPESSATIDAGGKLDVIIDNVICSDNPADDGLKSVELKFLGVKNIADFSEYAHLHLMRPPLNIREFKVNSTGNGPGFRDPVELSWDIFGADNLILSPGDIGIERDKYSCTTELLNGSLFSITASGGEQQISRTFEHEVPKAGISIIDAVIEKDKKNVIIQLKPANTQHVYATIVGRVKPETNDNNVEVIKIPYKKSIKYYTVSVENEDGLITEKVIPREE